MPRYSNRTWHQNEAISNRNQDNFWGNFNNMEATSAPVVDAGQTQYRVNKKRRFGKGKSHKTKTSALVEANKQFSLWRWQSLSAWDTATGKIQCNYNASFIAAPLCRYPLYLFDLDATPNANGGTLSNPAVAWRLVSTTNTGGAQLYFDSTTTVAQNAQGTDTTNAWVAENLGQRTTDAASIPGRRCIQDYIEGKMIFYGTTTYPTKWSVDIIKLKDDWLHPDWWANTAGASTITEPDANATVALIKNRTAFWQMMTIPYVSNPLNTQDPLLMKQFKVVRHVATINIEPKLNTEPNASVGHSVRQDMFVREDKVLKYDWNDTTLTASLVSGEGYQASVADMKTTTRPKTKTYLLIRAQVASASTSTGGTVDPTKDPTFDIFLRKKITTLG